MTAPAAAIRDPGTPEEWQDAVDAADFMLSLDAARKYGLVTGGPGVNVERCEAILQRGADAGFLPGDAVEASPAPLPE